MEVEFLVRTTVREHRWILADPPDAGLVASLARDINVPDSIAKILIYRGIDDYDKAKAYFRPDLALLHDPFILDGMATAVDRVLRGIEAGESFTVFGDYDVDGTNGAAMLYLFLQQLGATVQFYVPDRIREGYGISHSGIDFALEHGVNVFIAIDCGITAVEQVSYANERGLDVIICDHHEAGSVLPDAIAVLDPIKPGDPYPFKSLSGCGVGLKFIQGIARKIGKEEMIRDYLDFVTLASTADIVPLVGENRILVKLGLQAINTAPRPGIKALIDSAGLKTGHITTGQIVFALAPRINAAGRLGDATRAVRLLTSTTPEEARGLAQVLEEENRNRRKIDEDTFADAQQLVENCFDVEADPAIVLHQEHWHPGVVGIVASRMVERYYKPSIMMATVDGVAKGSARSVSGFDIYEALKRCEDKILQFGGHKYAAGLTVDLERLEEFQTAFKAAVKDLMSEELKTPEIRIDMELALTDITPRFIKILREFAPFGPQNTRPTFLTRNLEVAGTPRIVGRNHLRFRVRQNGVSFDAIGFGLGEMLQRVPVGRRDLDCVYTVEENEWTSPGASRPADPVPQLKIKDLR
ncbi:MAG: single-stranded-DNA-specific exonuclease RecJ [Ignavibacteriae bacterium]|nr:single-stranded-DNA-specific exonuclease RecJ [Ignavibacteriota bacterium]